MLGARRDPPSVQSGLAQAALAQHVFCFAAIATVIVLQLAAG
jgi:hypothetical protein